MIRQIQELSRHMQTYQNPVSPKHIQNERHTQDRGILRMLVYSETWHIQVQSHIKKEPWYIQGPLKQLQWSALQKQLTSIIIFAVSAFHVLSFLK